jgi:hypothetical protein
MIRKGHIIDRLLLGYAAGTLHAEARLLAATLAAIDPCARRRIAHYEAVGGRTLDDQPCVEVHCLEAVLEALDAPHSAPQRCALPEPLAALLGNPCSGAAGWGRARSGVARLPVRLSPRGGLFLLRLAPGSVLPALPPAALLLVIEGNAGSLKRGHITPEPPELRAGDSGCLCLVLADETPGPLKRLAALFLLPFLGE